MWNWAAKLFTGEDPAELQAESDRLDAQLSEQNREAHERGAINDATYAETNENIARGKLNVDEEITGAFNEGLQEGVDNVRGTIGDIVTAPLKLIDWRLYIIAGIALFLYMGGAKYLRGLIPKLARK
jgi:hypothetical protein